MLTSVPAGEYAGDWITCQQRIWTHAIAKLLTSNAIVYFHEVARCLVIGAVKVFPQFLLSGYTTVRR